MLQCWRRTGHLPPVFSSPPRGIWQLKSLHPREFAIQGKKMLMPGAQPGGGGRLGAGGIDWCIKIGPKVKVFVFRYICFVSRIWHQNLSPGSLPFFPSRKPGWNFSYEPMAQFIPVTEPARLNWAHMKRPLNSRPQLMSCKSENRLAVYRKSSIKPPPL